MSKVFKIILYVLISICVGTVLLIYFSPYGYSKTLNKKVIIETVEIDAPINDVYVYLGNSYNAKVWSVFVDHITPLNGKEFKDGKKGSIRRCFKNKNETGIFWDEKILIEKPNKKRQLNIYNIHGFSISGNGLLTEQLYETKNGKTELSFVLYLDKKESSWIKELKLYIAAYKVSKIFRGNIEKVKSILEHKNNKSTI